MNRFTSDESFVLQVMKKRQADNRRGVRYASLIPDLSKNPNGDWIAAIKSLENKGIVRDDGHQIVLTEVGFATMYPESIEPIGGGSNGSDTRREEDHSIPVSACAL